MNPSNKLLLEGAAIDAAFDDSNVVPLATVRDSAPSDAIRLFLAWCRRLAVDAGGEQESWVPVGHVGPVLIIGHQQFDAPCPFPSWLAQRVVISSKAHVGILAQLRTYPEKQRRWDGLVPDKPLPDRSGITAKSSVHDSVSFLLENFLLSDVDRTKLNAIRARSNATFNDLPDGYAEAIAFLRGTRIVDIRVAQFDRELTSKIPESLRTQHNVALFYGTDRFVYMASPAIPNHQSSDTVKAMLAAANKRRDVRLVLAPAAHLRETIAARANNEAAAGLNAAVKAQRQAANLAADGATSDNTKTNIDIDEDRMKNLSVVPGETPNEEFFHYVLYHAIRAGASDIHFEQVNGLGRIRFRKDGDMVEFNSMPLESCRALVGFAKSGGVVGLDTNNHATMDARAAVRMGKNIYNLRVNLTPHRLDTHQVMVIRILPKQSDLLKLEKLKLSSRHLRILRRAITRPNGLILVTGPTGSGKTTTLYACLAEINTPDVKINTIEDPIEIDLEGATQSQLNEDQGVDFTALKRAILRQDPDIILIGEIRDDETADLALQMAETGHLVFSTLHTNSEVEAVSRIVALLKEKDRRIVLGKSLVLLQAQRLVPRLCPACRKERRPTEEEHAIFAKHMPQLQRVGAKEFSTVFEPSVQGCSECRGGYSGRTVIMSLLPVSEKISEMVAKGRDTFDILEEAKKMGFLNLYEEALLKVQSGEISMAEAELWNDAWENFEITNVS